MSYVCVACEWLGGTRPTPAAPAAKGNCATSDPQRTTSLQFLRISYMYCADLWEKENEKARIQHLLSRLPMSHSQYLRLTEEAFEGAGER